MLESAIHRINHYPADKRNENQLRYPLDWGLHRVIAKASRKRTQNCRPTTPNIVGCYMLRPFAHPVACSWMLWRKV